jgi:hypothetical protein
MRGFPKHLNTKADYLYVKENFPPEQSRPAFQRLLDERFAWLPVGPLKAGDKGLEDKTHRVVEMRDESGQNVTERVQEEYREDPNATIFRLGFTVEEVKEHLS